MLELENMVHSQEQLSMDDITSPIGARFPEFSESELLQEALNNQNSDVASSSNCPYESNDTHHIDSTVSNQNNEIKRITKDSDDASLTHDTGPPPLLDGAGQISHDDILTSIDFEASPASSILRNYQYDQGYLCNISPLDNNFTLSDDLIDSDPVHAAAGVYAHERWPVVAAQPQPAVVSGLGYEDESPLPLPSSIAPPSSYISLRNNSSFMDPTMAPFLTVNPSFSAENVGVFNGYNSMLGNDVISRQDLDFQGENNGGLFLPFSLQRALNFTSDLQGLGSESQHLVHGGTSNTTPLASDITSFDDPSFKVIGKLSVEERQLKLHRYKMKRQERNFSKKIKYACRKTLADSRPRVRGRFAKNDELEELTRINDCNHEYDGDDDIIIGSSSMPDHQRSVVVKDEDGMDSSEILAHISGVNSFKCNYPIQSWIDL